MSDLFETFSRDFVGAAQSEGDPANIYLSSDDDDHMDCAAKSSRKRSMIT